jgi:hypothetical protein
LHGKGRAGSGDEVRALPEDDPHHVRPKPAKLVQPTLDLGLEDT